MYRVVIEKQALKYIEKLDRTSAQRIRNAIDLIATDPAIGKELTNHETARSYRVGQFRILYDVYENELVICIVKVGPRGDVYN